MFQVHLARGLAREWDGVIEGQEKYGNKGNKGKRVKKGIFTSRMKKIEQTHVTCTLKAQSVVLCDPFQ